MRDVARERTALVFDGSGLRFAIAISRFHEEITGRLLEGALAAFSFSCVQREEIDLFWVPGAFELPLMAHHMASSRRYDAILCLGAVIRGGTDHYEHVCRAVTEGIGRVALDTGVPVLFGVLTVGERGLALERSVPVEENAEKNAHGNQGFEAARAAVEMAVLLRDFRQKGET